MQYLIFHPSCVAVLNLESDSSIDHGIRQCQNQANVLLRLLDEGTATNESMVTGCPRVWAKTQNGMINLIIKRV